MGATLNTASAMNAYALTDRATWLKFANKGELTIVNEGDKSLFNPYGVILVNPKKHPHTKVKNGQAFINWLISDAGQRAIAAYEINGQQAFFRQTPTDIGRRLARRSAEGINFSVALSPDTLVKTTILGFNPVWVSQSRLQSLAILGPCFRITNLGEQLKQSDSNP